MKRVALILAMMMIVLIGFIKAEAQSNLTLTYSEQVFDFGQVGIEFRLFRTYWIYNNSDDTVQITKVDASCDCSAIACLDKVILPHDSVSFRLDYNTRDAYGPTTRTFTVHFENADRDKLKFFYLSNIGQWFNGIKPNPISLFFLPKTTSKKVTIPNTGFEALSVKIVEQADDFFDVRIITNKAFKGDLLELEITPSVSLTKGTYLSSFTLDVAAVDAEKPTRLTLPVKIVKY